MPHNQSAVDLGLQIGTVVKVTKEVNAERFGDNRQHYVAVTSDGVDVTDKIAGYALKNAVKSNKVLRLEETKTGGTRWSQVAPVEFDKILRSHNDTLSNDLNISGNSDYLDVSLFNSHDELSDFIRDAMSIKPKKLKINELWWRTAVRNALRGKNLLVVGPSGCGKTLLANSLKKGLGREDRFFYINLGSTQDPRSTLIGNTHYDPEQGTYVALSYFARAIQTPNALILLDEASRAHPEAHNILMTVLDYSQRYLRIDEKNDSETVKVAEGVTFILTANVGSEYTATRTMDRALLDRCTMIEMTPLGYEDELDNLRNTFPNVEEKSLRAIAAVANKTREEINSESPKVNTIVSTRMAEEWAAHVYDGFSLAESAEVCVYPWFSDIGGTDSERSYMRAVVQQHLPTEYDDKETPYRGGSTNDSGTPWG
jgi:MoxR-like ATPase